MFGLGLKKRHLIRQALPLTGMDLIQALSALHEADTATIHAGNGAFSAKMSVMIRGTVVNADILIGGVRRFGASEPIWRLELEVARSVPDWILIQAGERLLDALVALPRRLVPMEPMPEQANASYA